MNVRPEVLDGLSDKLLQRIGFQARVNEHTPTGLVLTAPVGLVIDAATSSSTARLMTPRPFSASES